MQQACQVKATNQIKQLRHPGKHEEDLPQYFVTL